MFRLLGERNETTLINVKQYEFKQCETTSTIYEYQRSKKDLANRSIMLILSTTAGQHGDFDLLDAAARRIFRRILKLPHTLLVPNAILDSKVR